MRLCNACPALEPCRAYYDQLPANQAPARGHRRASPSLMTNVAPQHVLQAAYWIGELIRHRQQFGHPIPQSLRDLHDALNCALLADEHPATPVLERLKSTAELAGQWNCHPTTVRRKAENAGGRKIGNRWVFHEAEDV